MNLRPRPPEPPELNLTPLVDVVFLLLLFFMVSTTFDQRRELPIALPRAEGQAPSLAEPPLVVGIDRDSRYFIAAQPLAATGGDVHPALMRALRAALGPQPSQPSMLIEADGETPHQAVMTLLDVARELGITRLAFATRPTPAAPDER